MLKVLLVLSFSSLGYAACPPGVKGEMCNVCMDNNYSPSGSGTYCLPCDCNDNHDKYYLGSMCNNVTGVCNQCVHHTKGRNCEICDDDFYGDAKLKTCRHCQCHSCGREGCNAETGDCYCKKNVKGKHCTECEAGHFGFRSCEGCKPCDCSTVGSWCNDCHPETGDCKCKPGVTGRKCDQCLPNFWDFSDNGCKACNCPNQKPCDSFTGECLACGEREKETACGCVGCGSCVESLIDLAELSILVSIRNSLSSLNETALSASISRALQKYYITFSELEESVNIILDAQQSINAGDNNVGLSQELEKISREVSLTLNTAQWRNGQAASLLEPIFNLLKLTEESKDFVKYNLTIEFELIKKDLIDLQKRGQKEQTDLIRQLSLELSNKLASTGGANDTLDDVMKQANATQKRVDIIYNKVVNQLRPVVEIEKKGDALKTESGSLVNDLVELQRLGLEVNDSAARTYQSLNFVLATKNKQYERDVPDAERLFKQIALRIDQAKHDAEVIGNITKEIAQLNILGKESAFELQGNKSQFGGWVAQLKINVANVTKQVELANKTINSILRDINANLTFGNVSAMAQDIETFFMLKDELFLSVEYAHTNTSEANQIADKLLLLTGEVEPRIGEINERTLNLSARNNFTDLGKKSLDDLNNHLGEIGFKKDRILAAINLISDTLQQLKNKEYEKWAQNISALANQVIYNAAETSRDVGRLREEAKESLDKLDNLRRDLKETREDMNEADDLVSRLPSLAKMAKDSMLRNEAEMKAAQDEKSNLDVKFARLDDKLREIRSAINMGMWAMKFDQTQKSYAKLRTPKIVETDYLQHDIRLVISGADSVAEPNGLLYFIGNPTASTNLKSDYMGLRLKEGKLEFFWSTSPGQRHIITTDVEFKPSESYTIRATRSGFETTLKVYLVSVKISSEQSDGTLLASASFSELEQYPKLVMRLSDKTRYFFGGVPTTETTFASLIGDVEHFKGCIHLFVLNNVVMNLWNYELASQVSACYPEKKQSPYYRNDDFGFACSWESNAYVKRNLPLSESFAVSGRVSSQERVQLTKIEMLEQSKNGSLIAYAVLRDKYSAAEIGKDFLRVVCRDNYTCEVQAADASVSNVYNVVDKRNNKKPLSQMKLDFMTNNDNIIFSSEINKIRRSNKIEDKSFTVKALQSFDLDLFIVGVNGEVKLLQKLKNGNAFENLESMMGCFRLRDLFASPTTHSEWLDYEKWVHAGLYLYPLATPVYTTMQLDGNDESLFAVVNPPAVGNRIAFQIKTEADSALLMFLMAPDEKSGVSVSLVNGKVSVRERRSKSPDDIYSISSEEPINDKQWHSVAVMKHLASRQWIVMVDDDREKTTIVQLKDLNTIEEISGQVMNVGGIPDTQTLDQYKNLLPSSKGFNGCIRDLIFEQTIEGNSAAVQIGDESEFKPAFKWNKLSPGIGSKGYKIGCEI